MADTLATQSTTLSTVASGTSFDIYKDASGNRFFPTIYITGGSADAWTLAAVDITHGLPIQPMTGATFVLGSGSAVIGHVVVDSGTITAVTAITNALPAGTNVIGHVIVDSGTITTVSTVTAVTAITNALPAGTNAIGTVSAGGFTAVPTASKTRPANTTAYSIGQVIAESTSAATVWTFTSCVRANGGTGTLLGVQLTDTSKQATTLQANLWLFSATPTVQNDAAAFAPSSGDLANLVAVVNLVNWTAANANGVITANELNRPFKCGAATTLYGVLVAANAYTPTSNEIFSITLLIGED